MSPGLGFADAVQRFADETMAREQAVFEATVNLAFDSIVDGSAITGAPGQPVVTGELRDSWTVRYSGNSARISTKHGGALMIELGTRRGRALLSYAKGYRDESHGPRIPIVLRAGNGGFHSLSLTRHGFYELVKAALAQVREDPGAYLPSSEGL